MQNIGEAHSNSEMEQTQGVGCKTGKESKVQNRCHGGCTQTCSCHAPHVA